MTIMAESGWDDARANTLLLADTAAQCIRDPERAQKWQILLNNVYQLLETFRSNPLFGHLSPACSAESPSELEAGLGDEANLADVRVALEAAIADTFQGESTDSAVAKINDVVRAVAFPTTGLTLQGDQRDRAARFFESVSNHLAHSA